jgi:hypothetical protein
MNWDELTSETVQKLINVIKDEAILPKIAFLALEDFLEKADEEAMYHLMVQMRLQLTDIVVKDAETTGFNRRLDIIANYGTQSKIYLEGMTKAFIYIEKEGKQLPAPPV